MVFLYIFKSRAGVSIKNHDVKVTANTSSTCRHLICIFLKLTVVNVQNNVQYFYFQIFILDQYRADSENRNLNGVICNLLRFNQLLFTPYAYDLTVNCCSRLPHVKLQKHMVTELPHTIKLSPSLEIFKSSLQTFLFKQAYV